LAYYNEQTKKYRKNNPQKARIKIKENHSTSLNHMYSFEEIDRKQTPELKKELDYWREKIMDYNFKYIVSNRHRFPYNVFFRLFGLKLRRLIDYWSGKFYFSRYYWIIKNRLKYLILVPYRHHD